MVGLSEATATVRVSELAINYLTRRSKWLVDAYETDSRVVTAVWNHNWGRARFCVAAAVQFALLYSQSCS